MVSWQMQWKEEGLGTCPVLYLLAGVRDPLLVTLMHVNSSAKFCRPGGHARVKVGVRNSYRLDASQLVHLVLCLLCQDIDAIPQQIAVVCTPFLPFLNRGTNITVEC